MEAKVDVRKLQILNDRINQTIDALNQVRLSVHGLGHTGGLQSQINPLAYLTQGIGMQPPYGIGAQGGFPGGFGGLQQGGMQGFPGVIPGVPFGLQHSPFQQLQQINPYMNPFAQVGSPWGQTGTPWGHFGQTGGIGGGIGGFGGGGLGGFGGGFGGGLSQLYGGGAGLFHSPFQGQDLIERQLVEARANDPFRITQTFPFVVS